MTTRRTMTIETLEAVKKELTFINNSIWEMDEDFRDYRTQSETITNCLLEAFKNYADMQGTRFSLDSGIKQITESLKRIDNILKGGNNDTNA